MDNIIGLPTKEKEEQDPRRSFTIKYISKAETEDKDEVLTKTLTGVMSMDPHMQVVGFADNPTDKVVTFMIPLHLLLSLESTEIGTVQ